MKPTEWLDKLKKMRPGEKVFIPAEDYFAICVSIGQPVAHAVTEIQGAKVKRVVGGYELCK
jgi:hypothetical protein